MPDMLVRLYDLPTSAPLLAELEEQGISIQRAMAPDKVRILSWIGENSSPAAQGEADVCFAHHPISLFLAVQNKQILGYACYHATALDFFGPTRVSDSMQGRGIGKALLIRSLEALRDEGYAYAIIGGVGPAAFYEKCVNAILIENSTPGIYRHFLGART